MPLVLLDYQATVMFQSAIQKGSHDILLGRVLCVGQNAKYAQPCHRLPDTVISSATYHLARCPTVCRYRM